MDGDYFVVKNINDDLLFVSITGNHTLYFTNASKKPYCSTQLDSCSQNSFEGSDAYFIPNPAMGFAQMILSDGEDEWVQSIHVFNTLSSVYHVPFTIKDKTIRLDTSMLMNGLYTVKIQTADKAYVKKLLVEH